MKYRPLGHTGLKVSEISLGSWTTLGGSVDESTSARLIHHAFAQGINLFDTADVYGRGTAERALGKALESLPREQVVVATKVMGQSPDGCSDSVPCWTAIAADTPSGMACPTRSRRP